MELAVIHPEKHHTDQNHVKRTYELQIKWLNFNILSPLKKMDILLDIKTYRTSRYSLPCHFKARYQCFGGTCYSHLQGGNI
jgi:hypothetical protein